MLPVRHDGVGVLSIANRHAAAYFSSVASSLCSDECLQEHRNGLARFADDTHNRLIAHVGPRNPETEHLEPILHRTGTHAMLDFPLYQRLFEENKAARIDDPKTQELKLQRTFSRHIADRVARTVKAEESTVGARHVAAGDFVYAHSHGRATLPLLARVVFRLCK